MKQRAKTKELRNMKNVLDPPAGGDIMQERSSVGCRTLRPADVATALGVSRTAAYTLVRRAEKAGGDPFKVMRLGNTILVSKKSFNEYLDAQGL